MSFGQGLTNTIGQVTPTFACVFKPTKLRTCFTKRKNGVIRKFSKDAPPTSSFLQRVKKKLRSAKHCCKHRCIDACASDDYMQQVAQWRRAWCMTPRCQKQAALMALVAARREKSMTAGESHDVHDVGTSHVDGGPQLLLRLSTAKRHDAPYHFLGKDLCSRSFLCCTGLSNNTLNSAVRFLKQGLTKYRQRQRNRHAVTQREMCQAIWMVIQDLHHQSPFAI